MWQYYDFRSNWDAFLETWQREQVQYQLCTDMQRFCETVHTFAIPSRSGRPVSRQYNRGDPLWWYSATEFWHDRAAEIALERIKNENMVASFKKTMASIGYKYHTKELLETAFFNACFENIVKECYPERNTIDAFIAPGSENYLSSTYYSVAMCTFPGETVIHSIGALGNCVIIPDHKIIFDISGYYFDRPVFSTEYDNLYDDFSSQYESSSSESF